MSCRRWKHCFNLLFTLATCCLLYDEAAGKDTSCGMEHCLKAVSSNHSGPGSLLEVLKTAHRYNSSLEVALDAGNFNLSRDFNDLLRFVEWRDFSLRGEGMYSTVLHCVEPEVGMVFSDSSRVTLRNLTLRNCAREFNSTTLNMSSLDTGDHSNTEVMFVVSRTALYFDLCTSVTLDHVMVLQSPGIGVAIYNTNGTNLFTSCQFQFNSLTSDDQPLGGGGVVIETSHCVPGDTHCTDNQSKLETADASYTFHDCYFTANVATSHYLKFDSVYPHGRSHVGLGKGGGLAVILKGRALRNQVVLSSCHFKLNTAEWGAALYLSFGDISVGNSILIEHSAFTLNNHRDGADEGYLGVTVGGGLRLEIVSYPADDQLWPGYHSNVTNNSISIQNSLIIANYATWGAGVSFVTTRDLPGNYPPNTLLFRNCTFKNNSAEVVGSAIDITSWKPDLVDSKESFMVPVLQDCTFILNKMIFNNITNYPVGIGIVYVAGVPTTFSGETLFLGNLNTALVVSQTYVSVMESSSFNFTSNEGRRGGALAFIGSSWLIAYSNTTFLFDGNKVGTYGLGGAIYSVHFGEHDLRYDQNCFFQYYKYSVSPDQWNTTFWFRNNMADGKSNTIYTTSSRPCDWRAAALSNRDGSAPKSDAFCENSTFIFADSGRNCQNEIATGPSDIKVSNINIEVYPGWMQKLGVQVLNDFGQHVPPVLIASPSLASDKDNIAIANSTNYITNDEIRIYGRENSSARLLLMTLDPRVVASEVVVKVKSCPPGFASKYCSRNASMSEFASNMTCGCLCQNVPGIECSNDSEVAYILPYYCITEQNNHSLKAVVGNCPYNQQNKVIISNLTVSSLEHKICGPFNRKGYLCSKCQPGYGVAVNTQDYRCVKCKSQEKYSWVLYLLFELGPITLVCFFVILFGVGVASPSMNAFVFFSQIISVNYGTNRNIWFFGLALTDVAQHHFTTPIYLLYGIWNLEFLNIFPAICLHQGLRTLHILVINYVKALYPMLLLGICYVCIKLYDRNTRVLHVLWKPFRYCQKVVDKIHKPKTSIIDAFATLIILSYSKFLYVSFPLLTLISVYELGNDTTKIQNEQKYHYYFDPDEILHHSKTNFIYFILGLFVVVFFVVLPPVFLILYPLPFSQRIVGKMNMRIQISLRTFADIFLGAFRDGTEDGKKSGGGDSNSSSSSCWSSCRGDYRWFAGLYFIVRIIIMGLYASSLNRYSQYLVQQLLCTFFLFLFAVLQPYKVQFYNALDCSFFALLAVLNSLSFFNFSYWMDTHHVQETVFYVNFLLVFAPIVYLIALLGYLLVRWRGCTFCGTKKTSGDRVVDFEESSLPDEDGVSSSETRSTLETDRLLPDRMVNPHNYRTLDRMSSINSSGSVASTQQQGEGRGGGGESEGQRSRQPSTDQPLNQYPRIRGNIQQRNADRLTV